MRKKTFSEEQIALALREAEMGTPVTEVCRKMGVSEVHGDGDRRASAASTAGGGEPQAQGNRGRPDAGQEDAPGCAVKKGLMPAPMRYLDARLTLAALEAAVASRCPGPGLIHHSDRGTQYAAKQYRERLCH
jgi:Transposase